jgi:hypothetical protein
MVGTVFSAPISTYPTTEASSSEVAFSRPDFGQSGDQEDTPHAREPSIRGCRPRQPNNARGSSVAGGVARPSASPPLRESRCTAVNCTVRGPSSDLAPPMTVPALLIGTATRPGVLPARENRSSHADAPVGRRCMRQPREQPVGPSPPEGNTHTRRRCKLPL